MNNNDDDDVEAGGDDLDDTGGGLCERGGTGGESISGGLSKLELCDEELSDSSEGWSSDWFRSILLYGRASSSSNIHNAPSDRASGAFLLADGCFGVFTRDPLRSGLIVL